MIMKIKIGIVGSRIYTNKQKIIEAIAKIDYLLDYKFITDTVEAELTKIKALLVEVRDNL